jgi:hypothetical protein
MTVLVAPDSDYAFADDDYTMVGFLLAAREISTGLHFPQDQRPGGVFRFVPLLSGVPYAVQLDLLGETWVRHCLNHVYDASLLDAAVLHVIGQVYAEVIPEDREWARHYIYMCPLQIVVNLKRRTQRRLVREYRRWWPGFDPSELENADQLQDYPAALAGPVYAALARTRLSPAFLVNLLGLFRPFELERLYERYGPGSAAGQEGG